MMAVEGLLLRGLDLTVRFVVSLPLLKNKVTATHHYNVTFKKWRRIKPFMAPCVKYGKTMSEKTKSQTRTMTTSEYVTGQASTTDVERIVYHATRVSVSLPHVFVMESRGFVMESRGFVMEPRGFVMKSRGL